MAVDNQILYAIMPHGSDTYGSTITWRYGSGKWSRQSYAYSLLSILREPNGDLIAGTTNGKILLLEQGLQDNQTNIHVTLLTRIDDGGLPLQRKDPLDIQLNVDTGAVSGTIDVLYDSSLTSTQQYSFSANGVSIYRINASDLGPFTRAQLRIDGLFSRFNITSISMMCRDRPQQVMAIDTGAIIGPNPRIMSWIREIEIDTISPADLEVIPYEDSVAQTTISVPVLEDQRTLYRVNFPNGLKARRPRILVRTVNADGTGDIGFEPYSIRVHFRASGHDSPDKSWSTVWPVGDHQ